MDRLNRLTTASPESPEFWDLVASYLGGELSPGERASVEAWLESDPARRAAFNRAAATWGAIPAVTNGHGLESSWRKLAEQIEPRDDSRHHRRTAWIGGGIAAAALAVGIAIIHSDGRPGPHGDPTEPQHTYTTHAGQITTLRLNQNIRITLGPATTLRVGTRHFALDGEAYFDVAHAASRPLTITTANATINVLGTRFAVRRYNDDGTSRIVVEEGKVGVQLRGNNEDEKRRVVLAANMLAVATDSTITLAKDIDPERYAGWVQGQLVFSKVSLRQAVADLSRAYGVTVRIADTTLANKSITLKVSITTQSLQHVLDMIGRVAEAHYTRIEDEFVLMPGRIGMRESDQEQYRRSFTQPERVYGK